MWMHYYPVEFVLKGVRSWEVWARRYPTNDPDDEHYGDKLIAKAGDQREARALAQLMNTQQTIDPNFRRDEWNRW